MIGRAVEMDDALEKRAGCSSGFQFFREPAVAERERNFRLVDDLREFARAQHRHGVDDDGAGLGGRQPRGDHGGIVAGAHEHAIAGLHAVILDQHMREPVGPVGEFLVGAHAAVADQRDVIAKALFDEAVAEFDAGVDPVGILKLRSVEQEIRPLLARRQIVARECVDVATRTQRRVSSHRVARHVASRFLVSPPSLRRRQLAAPGR